MLRPLIKRIAQARMLDRHFGHLTIFRTQELGWTIALEVSDGKVESHDGVQA